MFFISSLSMLIGQAQICSLLAETDPGNQFVEIAYWQYINKHGYDFDALLKHLDEQFPADPDNSPENCECVLSQQRIISSDGVN